MIPGVIRCLFLVSLLLLASCVRVPRLQDYAFEGPGLSAADREEFERHLLAEEINFKSLRMLSRCVFSYGSDKYEFRYAFVARAPGRLRIEQLPLTGFYSLSALVSDLQTTTVVFQNEQRAIVTPAGGAGLKKLLSIDVPLKESDVGLLLAGIVPQRLRTAESAARRDGDESADIVYRSSTLLGRFNQEFRLQELHLFDRDTQREQLEFRYLYDEQSLPRAFILRFPREDAGLECSALQRSRDQAVRDDVFSLTVPPGFEVEKN